VGTFAKYKGPFAGEGGFGIPATHGVGVAFKATSAVDAALDVVKRACSGIKSVNNPLLPDLLQAPLGAAGGAGSAWKDVTAVKPGVDWAMRPDLTLRGGDNYGEQSIPTSDSFFNMLAPVDVAEHWTLGSTGALPSRSELSLACM
jgi:long-chain fatty acid transport protein